MPFSSRAPNSFLSFPKPSSSTSSAGRSVDFTFSIPSPAFTPYAPFDHRVPLIHIVFCRFLCLDPVSWLSLLVGPRRSSLRFCPEVHSHFPLHMSPFQALFPLDTSFSYIWQSYLSLSLLSCRCLPRFLSPKSSR